METANDVFDRAGLVDLLDLERMTDDRFDLREFAQYTADHGKGTIILFENINEGIRNRVDYLRTIVALYFRFSLKESTSLLHERLLECRFLCPYRRNNNKSMCSPHFPGGTS